MARRTSPRRGARRLAPRRLGSGRRRVATDASPRGNGCVRQSAGAALSQRASRCVQLRSSALHSRAGPATGVRRRSRVHVSAEARLARHVHEEASVHAHVPHPPSGALERRRAGHGPRLRLHPPRPDAKHERRCRSPTERSSPASGASARSTTKTVRVVLRSRYSGWRGLFANVLPAHALEGQDLTKIWRDQIDDPRTGRPIGSGPFLVGQLGPRRAVGARSQPALLGAAPGVSRPDRHPLPAERRDPGRLVPGWRGPCCLRPLRRRHPGTSAGTGRERARRAERCVPELRLQDGPARPPRPSGRSSFAAPSRTRSIEPRSSEQARGRSTRTYRRFRACSFSPRARTTSRTGGSYRYRPAHAGRLFEQAGCRKGADGIYSCAGERLSLRFVTRAGNPGRARILELVQAQLRRSGVEVVREIRRPRHLRDDHFEWGLRRRALRIRKPPESDRKRLLRVWWERELHRLLPAPRDG